MVSFLNDLQAALRDTDEFPTVWVLLMSEHRDRVERLQARLLAAGFGVEIVTRPDLIVLRTTYRHYDAIIADVDGPSDTVTALIDVRRLEQSRGQPPTPAVALAPMDAVSPTLLTEAGFTEVMSLDAVDAELVPRVRGQVSVSRHAA